MRLLGRGFYAADTTYFSLSRLLHLVRIPDLFIVELSGSLCDVLGDVFSTARVLLPLGVVRLIFGVGTAEDGLLLAEKPRTCANAGAMSLFRGLWPSVYWAIYISVN